MSIIYTRYGNTVHTYSDRGMLIHGGFPEGDYVDAYDPVEAQRTYVETNDPAPTSDSPGHGVRTFRRSYIAQWIRAHGKWATLEAFLDLQPDFKFLWDYSTEFDDNNPMWPAAIAGVQQALELTDDEVAQLLNFGENGA